MKKLKFYVLWFALCLVVSGCGYTTKSILPKNIKTVYIEPFKNNVDFTTGSGRNIYLPLLEIDARNAIINRFLFDGNLKIAEPEVANLILKGELYQEMFPNKSVYCTISNTYILSRNANTV